MLGEKRAPLAAAPARASLHTCPGCFQLALIDPVGLRGASPSRDPRFRPSPALGLGLGVVPLHFWKMS